jgi:hypothetical protein
MNIIPENRDAVGVRAREFRHVLSLGAIALFLTGCAHVKPFFFRVQDASTGEPLPYFTVYWTESWQKTGATMPFRSRSGFLPSGGNNLVKVVRLRAAMDHSFRDNTFRFAAKGYEPLDVSYIASPGTPAVGVFNTRKSPRPLQVYVATNQVITIPLRKEQANDARH